MNRDLSDSLAIIQSHYRTLSPEGKQRVHKWCKAAIALSGRQTQLEITLEDYPPEHQWQVLRFMLPDEALPTLAGHLLAISQDDQLELPGFKLDDHG